MIDSRLKLYGLAVLCCFVLLLVPVLASAQLGGVVNGAKQGVEKGAQGVQQGAEEGYNKTKEGAQATKNAITGEDNNTNNENHMKPGQTQENESQTTETQSNTSSPETKTGQTSEKHMPRTAGELPLLALAGCLAFAAAGASRAFRRQS